MVSTLYTQWESSEHGQTNVKRATSGSAACHKKMIVLGICCWLGAASTHFWSEAEVMKLASGVESIHPIGKAIVAAAKALNCPNAVEGTFTEEPGSCAVATIDEKNVVVGSLEWVQRHGVAGDSPFQEYDEFKNQSVVYVGVDGVLAGVIYVEDQIRDDARHVIESLTRQGINTYLLFGDKKGPAKYVASAVGIPMERIGIPVAAGALLPVTGTMLSPSIAGALMGFSSIGVMKNSLLLRIKFTMIQNDTLRKSLFSKVPTDIENPGNEHERMINKAFQHSHNGVTK